jgi:hypothetical protein
VQADPGFGSLGGVEAMAVYDDGHGAALYVGGELAGAGGVPVQAIAKWDGTTWSAIGSGVQHTVRALAVFDDGSGPVLVAGGVTSAGGVAMNNIARWDGSNWSALGAGVPEFVLCLTVFNDGGGPALYAGGADITAPNQFGLLHRWNGTAWATIGSFRVSIQGGLAALTVFDDGTGPGLYAAGNFDTVWDVTGAATLANGIARWDGSAWTALGHGLTTNGNAISAFARAVMVFDDGSGSALYAAGGFATAGNVSASNLAKWDGASWSSLGGGLNADVWTLRSFDDGVGGGPDLYAGGDFTTAGGSPSAHIAEWYGCSTPIASICFGDGTAAPCPCSNSGLPGHGCNNSIGTGGARLSSAGLPILSADSVRLTSSGELSTALSVVLQGDSLVSPTAFGDGLRCAGGTLKRLYVKHASGGTAMAPQSGDPSISSRSAALGDPIPVGATRVYQVYYRDANLAFCSGGFNVSNGLAIEWGS